MNPISNSYHNNMPYYVSEPMRIWLAEFVWNILVDIWLSYIINSKGSSVSASVTTKKKNYINVSTNFMTKLDGITLREKCLHNNIQYYVSGCGYQNLLVAVVVLHNFQEFKF